MIVSEFREITIASTELASLFSTFLFGHCLTRNPRFCETYVFFHSSKTVKSHQKLFHSSFDKISSACGLIPLFQTGHSFVAVLVSWWLHIVQWLQRRSTTHLPPPLISPIVTADVLLTTPTYPTLLWLNNWPLLNINRVGAKLTCRHPDDVYWNLE